jgi:hypothetical protein
MIFAEDIQQQLLGPFDQALFSGKMLWFVIFILPDNIYWPSASISVKPQYG